MVKSYGEVLKLLLWDINSILLYKRPKFYTVLTAVLGNKLAAPRAKQKKKFACLQHHTKTTSKNTMALKMLSPLDLFSLDFISANTTS